MSKIWSFLNGNKTIICTIVFGFVARFGAELGMSGQLVEMILWIAGILGVPSLAHHIKKQVNQ